MLQNLSCLGATCDTYEFSMLLTFFIILITSSLLRPGEFKLKWTIGIMAVTFFAALGGAKVLFLILHPSRIVERGIIPAVKTSGVAYLGGLVLGFVAFWGYCRIIRVPFLVFADYAAPFFMLDRVIGRLGCLAYGCCYGVPSDLPWAYTFKAWGISELVPRHPTQAYAAVYALAILVSGRYLYRRLKAVPGVFALKQNDAPLAGMTFFYTLLCYGLMRFVNEFIRAEGPFMIGRFKHAHAFLLTVTVISAIGLLQIISRSEVREKLISALKGAFGMLAVWLIASGAMVLAGISLVSRR